MAVYLLGLHVPACDHSHTILYAYDNAYDITMHMICCPESERHDLHVHIVVLARAAPSQRGSFGRTLDFSAPRIMLVTPWTPGGDFCLRPPAHARPGPTGGADWAGTGAPSTSSSNLEHHSQCRTAGWHSWALTNTKSLSTDWPSITLQHTILLLRPATLIPWIQFSRRKEAQFAATLTPTRTPWLTPTAAVW